MPSKYTDATLPEVDAAMSASFAAFQQYKRLTLKERATFLKTIAHSLSIKENDLVAIAHQETHLEEARLKLELKRTIFQLTSYAEACEEGTWLDIRIDNLPGKPDLRKMLIPLGPVVVFGASNFPFAYSTAGGDTACALAAGCPAVLKAHPAHAGTSELVAQAVKEAAKQCALPEAIFTHLHGAAFEVGKALVEHPLTKAVGFTGSTDGGRALFDLANARPVPIPVFAEMGSVNPVFLLTQKLQQETESIAKMYAKSITQSAGQFCTNPGILVGIKSTALNEFKRILGGEMAIVPPMQMLHPGIAKNFQHKRADALDVKGVSIAGVVGCPVAADESIPTLAQVDADVFLKNPLLHQEVFGPFSLLVQCNDEDQMLQVAQSLEGQLTCTLMATENEAKQHEQLMDILKESCGRFILNNVPTGVEVCLSMHHGGPYPATTDSRFTAVGADGIRRFARPVCYQNWSNDLLPQELKNDNPLHLWRTINNTLTRNALP